VYQAAVLWNNRPIAGNRLIAKSNLLESAADLSEQGLDAGIERL
jgi:hypothetical protein